MIPLRDESTVYKKYTPLAVIFVILLNVAIFLYQRLFGPAGFTQYLIQYGMIPGLLTGQADPSLALQVDDPLGPFRLVSSIFMHGGFLHILGNMWFLWIFGNNIEEVLGRKRFLLFYLVTGVVASLVHVATDPSSMIPLVGASGAIAGVLGAYFLLFPRHRIYSLVPIGFYITTARVPAVFFLGIWLLIQILNSPFRGGIAFFAHIGGFIAGLVLIRFFLPPRKK